MKSKVLIRGGCVLTLGVKTPNFAEADVLIEGDRVAEVGRGLRARDAEVVDAAETIVMPGFVDAHRHAWLSLLRNLGVADAPGGDASALYRQHYEPDDVYAGTLIGLLGAVEAGITTLVDWCDFAAGGRHEEAARQAHADAGLRTVFVQGAPPDQADGTPRLISDDAAGPSTSFAFGSDEPVRAGLARVAESWGAARAQGRRIHAHVGSQSSEKGVVSQLTARGLLGEDVTLVHCTHLDDADLDGIAASKASVALTPASEMARGLGPPLLQGLIDRGIRAGLGVDDERVAPGDIFAQMRAANSLQHARLFDLKLAGKAGVPNLLSTRDVIRYATLDGARTAGLGTVTGSLEPGKLADVVVLRTDRPNISPVNDPIGAVVWGMDTSNVDWVFVGGRALMRHGALAADVAQASGLAVAAQRRVAAAAGLLSASAYGGEG